MATADGKPQPLQLRRQLETGHLRHFDVGEHDVGPLGDGERQRLPAVAAPTHDFDIRLGFEQGRQGAQNHGLIFGNHRRGCS